jgi:DNA-binding MarR family transcriptional regulator
MAVKKLTIADVPHQQIEELLYLALRSIYLFERVEVDRFDLNYQQMYLLKFLKRKSPFRISDIAGELMVPAFSATRLIKELEAKKLLLRSRDVKDKRNIFIRLSPAGEEMVRRIETNIVSTIISTLGDYNEDSLRVIIGMVNNLDAILGVPSPGSGAKPR